MVGGSLYEALGERNSEEASDSSELVSISDLVGVSVCIPCCLELFEGQRKAPHPEGGGRKMSGERNRVLVSNEVS